MSLEIAGGLFREILRLFRRDRSGTPGRRNSSGRSSAGDQIRHPEQLEAETVARDPADGSGQRREILRQRFRRFVSVPFARITGNRGGYF